MVSLAEKHQMDGPPEPLSLVIMHTGKGIEASRDEIFLRGRAVELGQMISGGNAVSLIWPYHFLMDYSVKLKL